MDENERPQWLEPSTKPVKSEKVKPAPKAPDVVNTESALITGDELAKMFRISKPTLYRQLNEGPIRKGGIDFRKIPDRYIGGKRFWLREVAEKFLMQKNKESKL